MNVLRSLALLGLASSLTGAQTPAPAPPCPAASPLLKSPPIYGVGVKTIANACPAFVLGTQVWFATVSSRIDAERWNASQIMTALTTGVLPPAPVITPPPAVVPPPVIVQPPPTGSGVHYVDDFSTYTTSAQLTTADGRTAGKFWYAASGHDMGGMSHPELISYDVAERGMRYDWPNRSTVTSCASEFTVAAIPRINPLRVLLPAGQTDLWVEFVSKESPGFSHGNPGCVRSYKFFLLQFERGPIAPSTVGMLGRAGMYLGDGTPASPTSTTLFMDISDQKGAYQFQGGIPIGGDAGWGGVYHRWTMELRGIGTVAATFTTYLDGKKLHTLSTPFLNGENIQGSYVLYLEMGANMNNGPDRAQSRWFKELGVYTTKPSGLP